MSKKRILIVEDDPIIRADLKRRVESLGYEIAGLTPSGQEAVQIAYRCRPQLALMDINLVDDMDGIEAARHLSALDVPVVFVTGLLDDTVLNRAKITEPYGYVVKPYETHDLKVSIALGFYKHQMDRKRRSAEAQSRA